MSELPQPKFNLRPEEILKGLKNQSHSEVIPDLRAQDIKQAHDLRFKWNRSLFWVMLGQLLIVDALILLVGTGTLTYPTENNVIEIFVTGTFVQIIGLIVFIIKYLFKTH